MIVSLNTDPNREEFELLLKSAILQLNSDALRYPAKMATLLGRSLEPYIKDLLSELSIGTSFENSIELIGGQRFPDIIAKKFYGVEVKTTSQNHWKTTGNSVLESTRVEDVERIFMLFAKMSTPIEFRCRPYEDVLSEIVVTHSPRYLIDMNLETGKTIFDKINLSYDTLRKSENPIRPIVEYYKKKLKPGEELWWIDQENYSRPTSIVIKIWNSLTKEEKSFIRIKAMAYFPEIFSNSSDKFNRLAVWLATKEAVVCPNIRDLFTAGGKGELNINGEVFVNVPRIFLTLTSYFSEVIECINNTANDELSEFWKTPVIDKNKVHMWTSLISGEAKTVQGALHLDIDRILKDKLK